jgi:hypothetical protein
MNATKHFLSSGACDRKPAIDRRVVTQSKFKTTLLLSASVCVGAYVLVPIEARADCTTSISVVPCTISTDGSYSFSGSATTSVDPNIEVTGGTISFSNTGSLANTGYYGSVFTTDSGSTVSSFANSGTMTGDYVVSNYGTITDLNNSSQMYTTNRDVSAIFNWNGTITSLTNSGTIAGGFSGIENYGTITTLYNSGTIGAARTQVDIYNNNISSYPYGTIVNLHNSQQGLTYEGKLPTNYYVVVDSNASTTSGFGTLVIGSSVSAVSGTTTIGISSYSSVARTMSMYGVISGVASSNLLNHDSTVTYSYGGVTYGFTLTESTVSNTWDLIYTGIVTTGPDSTNTTIALLANAISLRGIMDRRLSALSMTTGYDCATFDKSGYCLSFQARYSNYDSMNDGGGVLTAGYKVNDQWRLGAFLDYRASESGVTNIKLSTDLPTVGIFGAYSQNGDRTGLQAKLVAAIQKGSATITRTELTSTEPGAGKGSLNAHMVSGELGFGYQVAPSVIVTPFAGLRYTDATRGSYTEDSSSSVSYPISYSDYAQRLTTATLGARVAGMFTEKLGYQIGAGVDHDLRQQTSTYSGTSTISGLTSFDLSVDGVNNRTRGFASAGLFYQLAKNERLTGNVSLRNQAYTSQNVATFMGGYQIAF